MKIDIESLFQLVAITNESVNTLSGEMKGFKDEMKDFKDEMKETIMEMKEDTRHFKENVDKTIWEMKEDTKKLKKDMDKKWGDIGNRIGDFVEDFVQPNVKMAILDAFGLDIGEPLFKQKEVKFINGEELKKELDVMGIVEEEKKIFIVESKSTINRKKIDKFHNFITSGAFYSLWPKFKGYSIVPIMASLSIPTYYQELLKSKNIYPKVFHF